MRIISAAVCWNRTLHILAFHTNQLHVLASIDEAWQTAQNPCKIKQTASPCNCNAPNLSSGDVVCISSAKLARGSIIIVIVNVDDGGSSGWWGLAIAGLSIAGLSVCRGLTIAGGWWLSVARLSIRRRLSVHNL